MKNTIKNLLAGIGVAACTLLLIGAVATATKYTGTFVGNGAGLTNASGWAMSSLGTAALSNHTAFLYFWQTNQPASQITNSGTAIYSNGATAFLFAQKITTNDPGDLTLQGTTSWLQMIGTGEATGQKIVRFKNGAGTFALQRANDANQFQKTFFDVITNNWQFGVTVQYATNSLDDWPAAPHSPGAFAVVNSNGFGYILLSTNGGGGGSATWTGTNQFGW